MFGLIVRLVDSAVNVGSPNKLYNIPLLQNLSSSLVSRTELAKENPNSKTSRDIFLGKEIYISINTPNLIHQFVNLLILS